MSEADLQQALVGLGVFGALLQDTLVVPAGLEQAPLLK
jgi:hypothetical protein